VVANLKIRKKDFLVAGRRALGDIVATPGSSVGMLLGFVPQLRSCFIAGTESSLHLLQAQVVRWAFAFC
jgi:hypothetical protein